MFSSIDQIGKMPSAARSPETNATRPRTTVHLAGTARGFEYRTENLPLPPSLQPGEPDDLPARGGEADPTQHAGAQIRDFDELVSSAGAGACSPAPRPACRPRSSIRCGCEMLLAVAGPDDSAIPHHDDAVGDLERLLQAV